jgi:ribosomal protein S18 acetylase RimI-like enzyme
MKKEKIEILRYNKVDENLAVLIELHKLISKNNKLNNHLIYFDTNFPSYFKKIIADPKFNYIFTLRINGEVEGVIHFKIFDDIIFLNNICLSENCQGKGFGKIFLFESLNLLNKTDFKYFNLDVFMSNQQAFLWYKNFGLEENKSTKWTQIFLINNQEDKNLSDEIIIKKDLNGFNSLFFNDLKIATIVNNTTMLLHDLTYIKQMPLNNYILITNQNTELLQNENFNVIDLDTSVRMVCPMKTLLNNLIN